MELPRELVETTLLPHSRLWSENRQQRVWKFRYQHPDRGWMHDDWARLVSWLRGAAHSFEEDLGAEVLEVVPVTSVAAGGALTQVVGVPAITQYCLTESMPEENASRLSRAILAEAPVAEKELALRVTSVVEETMPAAAPTSAAEEAGAPEPRKHYHLRKSFSYHSKQEDFTIVLSMVRSSPEDPDGFASMREAGVPAQPVSYHFELWVGGVGAPKTTAKAVTGGAPKASAKTKKKPAPSVVEEPEPEEEKPEAEARAALDRMLFLYRLLHNDPLPISRARQAEVLAAYHRLVGEKRGFFVPKPVTLERMHLAAPGYGVQTIQSGYAVTEKADGERMLLYIDGAGEAYLLNNTLEVRRTGLRATGPKMKNSLVDGEFVACQKRRGPNSGKDLFVAFDIYYADGASVMDLPLLPGGEGSRDGSKGSKSGGGAARMPMAEAMMAPSAWDARESFVSLRAKRHLAGEGEAIFALAKKILDGAEELPYEIDGLVYTPVKLGVFGYYPGRPPVLSESGKWDRVLKWKPPAQNTIDFLVVRDPAWDPPRPPPGLAGGPPRLVAYKLMTGKAAARWSPISVQEGLRRRYDRDYREQLWNEAKEYRAEVFRPFSYYHDGVGTALLPESCENGDRIEDQTIVEMAYDPETRRWSALRVREDKTRIYKQTGRISKTANDFSVATSIWRTIHEPVTVAMITEGPAAGGEGEGAVEPPEDLEERLLGADDTYYAREIPRQHMLSRAMLDFHNHGIKRMLYNLLPASQRGSLLELACGMAGDLPRWRAGLYRFVLGIDLVRDNITHPTEGSYARLLRNRLAIEYAAEGDPAGAPARRLYPDTVFVIGDCAKPIHDGSAAADLDEESRRILQLLYHRNAPVREPYLTKHLLGRAAAGFDLVSCQFAIHYFFRDTAALNGFFYNVARNLKRRGGLFIATFMDGDRVHQLLTASEGGVVEGRKLGGEVATWAIIRRYESYGPSDAIGKRVDVFLENTGRVTPEYLVRLDTLLEAAAEHGLELHSTALFSEEFARLREASPGTTAKELRGALEELAGDEVQKQFSFLNRWVVLRPKPEGSPAGAPTGAPSAPSAPSVPPPPPPSSRRPPSAAPSASVSQPPPQSAPPSSRRRTAM